MSAAPKSDAEILRSAQQSAERVAQAMHDEQMGLTGRPDRDKWSAGEQKLAGVERAARRLADRISSTFSNDQT